MIFEGQRQLRLAPWISIFPGVCDAGPRRRAQPARRRAQPGAQSAAAPPAARAPKRGASAVTAAGRASTAAGARRCSRCASCAWPTASVDREIRAVDGVSFTLPRGGSLGIVGESGCGKSSLGAALLQVLPPNAELDGGDVSTDGRPILRDGRPVGEAEGRDVLDAMRWTRLSMIFQSAMNALNPVLTVAPQLDRGLPPAPARLVHDGGARRGSRAVFDLIGIPRARIGAYPHELSGGMRQRVMIALEPAARARTRHRRRADDGARRADPGPDPRRDRRAAPAHGPLADPDLARHGRGGRDLRAGRRDVCRRDRRDRADGRESSRARSHPYTRALLPPCRRCPARAARSRLAAASRSAERATSAAVSRARCRRPQTSAARTLSAARRRRRRPRGAVPLRGTRREGRHDRARSARSCRPAQALRARRRPAADPARGRRRACAPSTASICRIARGRDRWRWSARAARARRRPGKLDHPAGAADAAARCASRARVDRARSGRALQGLSPPRADDLPEPLRGARPALHASCEAVAEPLAHPRHRQRRRAARQVPRQCSSEVDLRPAARFSRAATPPIFGRPAAARGDRPRAGARAAPGRRRRAGEHARRVGARRRHEPDAGAAATARASPISTSPTISPWRATCRAASP